MRSAWIPVSEPSERETADDRAARRADRIRKKLGWEPGILNGDGWKPKGMHWNTAEEEAQAERLLNVRISKDYLLRQQWPLP